MGKAFGQIKKDAQDAVVATGFSPDILEQLDQDAHGFAVLNAIYNDGTEWKLAKADAMATVGTHLVAAVLTDDSIYAVAAGTIRATAHGYTPGDTLYVDASTAGDLTNTEPSISNPKAFVVDADHLQVLPYRAIQKINVKSGRVTGVTDGGSSAVTFNTAFGSTPNVVATLENTNAADDGVRVSAISTAGFTINIQKGHGGGNDSWDVQWIATDAGDS